ncbi:hypothetical protein TNCV_3223821 [Trichonephila clavipes]|nr:hypothetical protein TNCV_3223821 [Trichonephila clavipes]
MPYERLRKMASSLTSRSYRNAGRNVLPPKGTTLKVDVFTVQGCGIISRISIAASNFDASFNPKENWKSCHIIIRHGGCRFLHHENPPTWAGVETTTLAAEDQQQNNNATQPAKGCQNSKANLYQANKVYL